MTETLDANKGELDAGQNLAAELNKIKQEQAKASEVQESVEDYGEFPPDIQKTLHDIDKLITDTENDTPFRYKTEGHSTAHTIASGHERTHVRTGEDKADFLESMRQMKETLKSYYNQN